MIYLKAADEATFNQAVVDAGWTYQEAVSESDDEVTVTNYYTATHSLDVIGVIHVETGNMLTGEGADGETFEYPEMAPIEGWHANLLLHGEELPAALEPFVIVAPSTPVRKFA
jgi:hypothetical protein